jgi:hypothetical protein
MRNFQILDRAVADQSTGILTLTAQTDSPTHPTVALRQEGEYIVISASYGPLEIALRLRYSEFSRILQHIQPNDGLNTTRQIGAGEAYLALGLHTDGSLIFRPTIVGDARGYFAMNLRLTSESAQTLTRWLGLSA